MHAHNAHTTLQFQLTHKNNSQCVIINMYLSQIEYTIQKHECTFIFHLSNLHYINAGNFTCGHMHRAAYIFGRFAHGESRGKSRFEANLSIRALVPQNYRAGVRHAAVAAQATGRADPRWFGQTYQNRHRYLEIIARHIPTTPWPYPRSTPYPVIRCRIRIRVDSRP
jgi:hypothetical protein